MADTKLEYWYDWKIEGPDGTWLINLRQSPPPLDEEKLDDIDYLCERIHDYPEATLMNEDFWYRIVMLRQKVFKDEKYSKDLRKVCKAIAGDGRAQNSREEIEKLRKKIMKDISFFKKVLDSISGDQMKLQEVYEDFLLKDVDKEDCHEVDRQFKKTSNCEKIWNAYKKVFDRLKQKLSYEEIFCFFGQAASCLGETNANIHVNPDGRSLTFVKQRTWYVKGTDMHLEVVDS